jgi:aryl-alcohol dehydrogenase-like predicted oxidoreductase
METRAIGSLQVSVVGLGCNQFGRKIDADTSRAVVDAALEAGVNFLDTSDRYGNGDQPFSGRGRSEEFIGLALEGRRDQVVLATKFGNPIGDDPRDSGAGRRWVPRAIEFSLERLRTDHVDLYQLHRPDPDTPIEETLEVLTELCEAGKVREIGCSNFTAAQLREAAEAAERHGFRRFVSVQNEYSLLCREPEQDGVLEVCREHDIAFLPYFPLAGGLLTGKYARGEAPPEGTRLAVFPPVRDHLGLSDENLARVERLGAFASQRGHTLIELAFSWLASQPQVASVIAGATSPAQAQANARHVAWSLSDEELAELAPV